MSNSNETKEVEGKNIQSENNTEVHHEHTLYSENIIQVNGFNITNSLLNSWLVIIILLVLGLYIRKRISVVPSNIQGIFEMIIEKFFALFDSVTKSRSKTLKYFPLVFTFFIFILLNNWLGLLPGVGSIGYVAEEHGGKFFIPFFRGGTADLNTTLALAIIGVVVSHIFGVLAIGVWGYINKYLNFKILLDIPKKVFKEPTVLIVNPIKAFVGVVEIIGEIAKVASLSFRLFGNIFAGEVLLASMSAILAFGLPIPFMFLEIIVGLIQALIFAILILAYLSMNTVVHEH